MVFLFLELPIYDRRIYYALIFSGFLLMTLVNCLRRKKYSLSLPLALLLSLITEVFGIAGAFLLYCLENIGKGFYFGFSFFGTVFFIPLFWLISPVFKRKISYRELMNFIAVTLPLELAVIRIGCTLEGCCYGIIFPWGIRYENVIRFPVQLMEACLDIITFFCLLINERKFKNKINNYVLFVFLYSVVRLICEFFRDDSQTTLLLTNGQFFSIAGLIISSSVILYAFLKSRKKKNTREI